MGRKTLLIFVIAVMSLASCGVRDELVIYPMYAGDLKMWEHIWSAEDPYEFESAPLGVILPHHMVAAFEISRFYQGLAEVVQPSMVVVIGPNHYESGEANIQTCFDCEYFSVIGNVEVDRSFADRLVNDDIAVREDGTFRQEHAIFAHAPFIKKFFPEARIVPILLQWEMPVDEVLELSEWLNENLPEDALVIASVDFSHYISWEAANFHDKSSYASIKNFDFENIYDLEVDSPSSIYALLDLMRLRSHMRAERLEHTNMAQYVESNPQSTTSHQYFAFYEGDVEPTKSVTIMNLVGIGDEGRGLLTGWDWDRDEENDGLLRDLKGAEDRFLVGSDFLVFGLENGCRLEEQNGVSVSFCGGSERMEADVEYILEGDRLTVKSDTIESGELRFENLSSAILGLWIGEDGYEVFEFSVKLVDGYYSISSSSK